MSVDLAAAPRRWALGAAGGVLALGFGALAIASALELGDMSLPGLYTFRSATIGDGLLLPLLAYSLVRSSGRASDWNRADRRGIIAMAVVGALAGTALQVSWLNEPQPRVNWTLPAAGTFNLVGWYHAVFFIAACAFFAGTSSAAVFRLRHESRSGTAESAPTAVAAARVRSLGLIAILFSGLAFTALLAEDNTTGDLVWAYAMVWLVGLTVLAITVLTWAVGLAAFRWCALAGVAAAIPAMSTSLFFLPGRMIDLITVLPVVCAALVGAFGASALGLKNRVAKIVVPMFVAVCAAGPIHAFSSLPTVTIPLLVVGCAISAGVIVIELLVMRALFGLLSLRLHLVTLTPLTAIPIIAYSLAGRYFAQEQDLINPYAVIVGIIVGALFAVVSVRAVRVIFDAVIRAEEANTAHEELSGLKWTAYLAISTVYAAALMACLVSLIGTTSAGQWISGVGGGLSSLVVLALILMALGLVIAVCSSRAARVVAPLACLTWTVVMGWQLSGGYGDWKQAVLSALIAVVVGLFVLEGILGNVGYLHGVPIGWTMLSTAVPCALVAGSTVAWLTGPALWSSSAVTSVPLALISLVIGATACVSLPWLAARTLPGARSIRQYGLATTPIDGVLQDCFLVTSLSIIITWVPNLFMAHLDDGAAWWNTIPPFFALFSATYMVTGQVPVVGVAA